MSLSQFQSGEPLRANDPLRSQRMTADEAASVIALWQQEQTRLTGLTDKPTVPDVAEGLDITVEDVQRLLEAVRTQRLEEEQALAQEQELAEAQKRLAEEERRLAEIHQQRTSLRQEHGHQPTQNSRRSTWMEVKPGVWEDAEVQPDTWLVRLVKLIFFILLSGLFIAPLLYAIMYALSLMQH